MEGALHCGWQQRVVANDSHQTVSSINDCATWAAFLPPDDVEPCVLQRFSTHHEPWNNRRLAAQPLTRRTNRHHKQGTRAGATSDSAPASTCNCTCAAAGAPKPRREQLGQQLVRAASPHAAVEQHWQRFVAHCSRRVRMLPTTRRISQEKRKSARQRTWSQHLAVDGRAAHALQQPQGFPWAGMRSSVVNGSSGIMKERARHEICGVSQRFGGARCLIVAVSTSAVVSCHDRGAWASQWLRHAGTQ